MTEYQVIIKVKFLRAVSHFKAGDVTDYCREQVYATNDADAAIAAAKLITMAVQPQHAELGIGSIEVWHPRCHIVMRDWGYLPNEQVGV